jgi:hypothetical protein
VSEGPQRPVADVESAVRTRLVGEVDNEELTERKGCPSDPPCNGTTRMPLDAGALPPGCEARSAR